MKQPQRNVHLHLVLLSYYCRFPHGRYASDHNHDIGGRNQKRRVISGLSCWVPSLVDGGSWLYRLIGGQQEVILTTDLAKHVPTLKELQRIEKLNLRKRSQVGRITVSVPSKWNFVLCWCYGYEKNVDFFALSGDVPLVCTDIWLQYLFVVVGWLECPCRLGHAVVFYAYTILRSRCGVLCSPYVEVNSDVSAYHHPTLTLDLIYIYIYICKPG